MARTIFGKSRPFDKPYAIYKGFHPDLGDIEVRVLKTYMHHSKEATDRYVRWFVAASSEATFGGYDMGDDYAVNVKRLRLAWAEPEWMEAYNVRA